MTATSSAVPTSTRRPARLLRRLGSVLAGPFRFYRQRIYAQLIASHLLVALLMAVLLTVVAFGLFLVVIIPNAAPPLVSAAAITEQDRMLSRLITADDIARLESPNSAGTARQVTAILSRAVAAGQPDESHVLPVPSTRQDLALLTDPWGIVLATSDPSMPLGQPVDRSRWPLAAAVEARFAASANPVGTASGQFFSASGSTARAVGYVIPASNARSGGLVILRRTDLGPMSPVRPPRLATVLAAFAALAVLLFTLPALVLAVPFGAWRARRVSRRLGSLEAAADAMARGDLARRIARTGDDEIGRLGERFNAMAASLEAADRQRRSFVANVSHELRTPVAIVQANAERLLHATHVGAGQPPEELQAIQHEAAALARLIDDLFTLARLDEAVLPIEPVSVDLATVVGEVVDGIRGTAWDQRRVVVRSLVSTSLPAVLADPTRLRQILGNLVHNGLRYTPEGGIVVVDADRTGNDLVVSVSDTGVGIPTGEIDQVFRRFYRGTQPRGDADAGGLGLAIVKQLVEAQGGTIVVESSPGQGTVFRFTLPVAHPAA
ncbi:MAG TPA: HAMP domain-containing sensor histidine kinase [Thermomicrobiaceae bacterium]|nr:HAMP domain-containing sensor histidine kinase [Thermomicrobiaceae bacterium]